MGSPGDAFAPSAISNFFSIHDEGLSASPPDLVHVGATGGGYMLSKGVHTAAEEVVASGAESHGVRIIVNGDANYPADTTRTAIEMLLRAVGRADCTLEVIQRVEVPISYGFGASAASALSGVVAVAKLLGVALGREQVAYYAHAADILCRTGLGTVSAIYRFGGAGVITRPGAPGIAEVRRVHLPRDVRVVTACLAPYGKAALLSSSESKKKVNRLGDEALARASEDLELDSLVHAAEVFSNGLGLESIELRRLERSARQNGAIGASQNMVGDAIHALVWDDEAAKVARALEADESSPRVEVFELWHDDQESPG